MSWKKHTHTIEIETWTHTHDEHCTERSKSRSGTSSPGSGPAKVSSAEYLREWQRIFGGKPKEGKA